MKNTHDEQITHAILTDDGRVLIQQSNGSYVPVDQDKTDLSRLDAMKDGDIDYSEMPELDESFFAAASMVSPRKQQLTIRIDSDLLDWLRQQGRGYQTRINTILRAYMQMHKGRSA